MILSLALNFNELYAQFHTQVEWTKHTSMFSNDVLYYERDNKLVWEDFRGIPVDKGRTAAVTMSGFGYNANMHSSGQNGDLTIQVYCFFQKDKSWVKPEKTTSYILNHEQHHFDISFLAAKMFIDRIKNVSLTRNNYNNLLPKIYDEYIERMNKMQDEYDSQTKNGQEKNLQEKWNRFIDEKITLLTK